MSVMLKFKARGLDCGYGGGMEATGLPKGHPA